MTGHSDSISFSTKRRPESLLPDHYLHEKETCSDSSLHNLFGRTGLDALGADLCLPGLSVDFDTDLLKIWKPAAFIAVFCVADIITSHRLLSTYGAFSTHNYSPY
jgi:hypothetical protein